MSTSGTAYEVEDSGVEDSVVMPMWIEEPSDPRLADFTSLKDVALRRVLEPARGLYIAESAHVIRRAVGAGHRLRSIVMDEVWVERSTDLIDAAARVHAPVYVARRDVLSQVAGFHVHRGALAAVERPALPSVAEVIDGARRVVVLADIVDHTNVGAIFRSVAGLGADAVLISPGCADPLYRRSVRVSMGAVLEVPWTRLGEWPGSLRALRDRGFVVAGLALDPHAIDLETFAQQPPQRCAVVLGTEGDGLSPGALAETDLVVRIPMSGGVDSLNVAAAAAVALWALRDGRG